MGFDHKAWLQVPDAAPAGADSDIMSDWAGLRARFTAAQALRRAALEFSPKNGVLAAGSFDRASARSLAGYAIAQRGVNPTDLVDGKGRDGNDADVAGASKPGDRG